MIVFRLIPVLALSASCVLARSDPASFDAVIDVPPAVAPELSRTSNTQWNVLDGGSLPFRFEVGEVDGSSENIEVNFLAPTAAGYVRARGGVTVNLIEGNLTSGVAFSGSTFNLRGGAVLAGFNSNSGSVVNISGSTVMPGFRSEGGEINISGGEVGHSFAAFGDTVVNLTGGVVGNWLDARRGTHIRIAGGELGQAFEAHPGSWLTMTAGVLGRQPTIFGGAVATISGGSLSDDPVVYPSGELHLVGDGFALDGVAIPDLIEPGDTLVVAQRENRLLTGELTDGSQIGFRLSETFQVGRPWFHRNAIVRLTVGVPIPEPASVALFVAAVCASLTRMRR